MTKRVSAERRRELDERRFLQRHRVSDVFQPSGVLKSSFRQGVDLSRNEVRTLKLK